MRLLTVFLLITFFGHAQNRFITELNFGETLQYDVIEVEFVKVINDSRCPKNVQCIRAGEAKVLVNIYNDGKFLEEKELVFFASGVTNETHNVLMFTKDLRLKGLTLYPYPSGLGSIPEQDYFLQIQVN